MPNFPQQPDLPSHTETGLQEFSLVLQHISSPEGILQGQTWQKGLGQSAPTVQEWEKGLGCLNVPLDVREAPCSSLALFPDDGSGTRS